LVKRGSAYATETMKNALPTKPVSMVVERNKPRFDTEGPLTVTSS